MKNKILLLFITGYVCSQNLNGQIIDTVAPFPYSDTSISRYRKESSAEMYAKAALKRILSDTTTWAYKMESSQEKWFGSARKKDYQLFAKCDWNKAKKKSSNTGNISYYGKGTLFWLNDIDEVEVAAAGITQQNAGDYIYHVVMNDSTEIIPWTKPVNFRNNGKITYAYLGKFDTKNKFVRLEIYNIRAYYDRSIWTFNSLYMPKARLAFARLNYNNQYLFRPFQQHYIPSGNQLNFAKDQWERGDIRFHWSDLINHIEVDMENTIQNDMYNVYLRKKVQGKTDTVYISYNWELSHYSPNPVLKINSSYFNKPGSYEIIVVPEAPDEFKKNTWDKAVTIPFTVLPSETKAFTTAQVVKFIGALLLLFGIIFIIYHLINKRRLAKEAQRKEMALLQLQSVRSQLNPHFMFNALAGIQNLMNKNDINAANLYLAKFARLTRNVLDDNNKDMIGISEELSLQETYLQMEQMRFGFQYDIFVDDKIDQANTEIPAMLLQPFVENAVKHGVSSLNGNGQISIAFRKEGSALLLEVKDNGKGFGKENTYEGNGTRLSAERIDLLNRLYKKTIIPMHKKSDHNGTVVSIQLNGYNHAFNSN